MQRKLIRNNLEEDMKSLQLEETLFHNANGYVGIRGALEEGSPCDIPSIRGTYLNGIYNCLQMPQAEPLYGLAQKKQTIVNTVDVQHIKLFVDRKMVRITNKNVIQSKRVLDMDLGITQRLFEDDNINLTIDRLASFVHPQIFAMQYRITAKKDITLQVDLFHNAKVFNYFDSKDPRVATAPIKHIVNDDITASEDGISLITSHTSKSNITVISALKDVFSIQAKFSELIVEENEYSKLSVIFDLSRGQVLEFNRYCSFADSIRYTLPKESALKALSDALALGFCTLAQEQKSYMDKFWSEASVNIEGDAKLSLALSFNLYQLLQSVAKDEYGHIAAKGLSGEGYEGHYFWDTEIYVQPFFTLVYPELSRTLLTWRYRILPFARDNAKQLNHKKGVLYPWRTINGKECSGFFPSGTAQYHINSAIAYAIWLYYVQTADDEFMQTMGLEMLFEIARLWLDVGNYSGGKFVINCVTGPDEYTCLVNNNYYTNMSAKHNLAWAVKYYYLFRSKGLLNQVISRTNIKEYEIKAFQKAANKMFIPYDEELDISPQDDSFLDKKIWVFDKSCNDKSPLLLHYHPLVLYRYKVCKQADAVLAHFLYGSEIIKTTILNSFRYYEKITTHDSSLSKSVFSIVASFLGLNKKAYKYFGNSAEIDMLDLNGNTKDGIHTANMGGSYLALVFGFAGYRVNEKGVYLNPRIPTRWKGYDFSLKWHNIVIKIKVNKKQVAINVDSAVHITIYGNQILCKKEKTTIVRVIND